jgi:hypothetical protein
MQFENRILVIHHMPDKKAFLEPECHNFTHAWFPVDKFDEVEIGTKSAFGRLGAAYVALLSAGPLFRVGDSELKQFGAKQFWICECSSEDVETFASFAERVKSCPIKFDGTRLVYGNLSLVYNGAFRVDGTPQPTQYKRYDSAYCIGERGADNYIFKLDGESLAILR